MGWIEWAGEKMAFKKQNRSLNWFGRALRPCDDFVSAFGE